MLEDERLKFRFRCGNPGVLAAIYDKYADYLLTLATALLNDPILAEDVLHDVFVSFARSVTRFQQTGSLKAYLAKSVLNRSRDYLRKRRTAPETLSELELQPAADSPPPDRRMMVQEQSLKLTDALAQIPDEQREVVVLRMKGDLTFRRIAAMQEISIDTAQARYRYGISKLRSLLNGELVQ